MSARRSFWTKLLRTSLAVGCLIGALPVAPFAVHEARANPPHARAHSGYQQAHTLAAAQRVAHSAERLEHALAACRSSRHDVQMAEQVERRAAALHESLRCHASPHHVRADFAALGAAYRALDAHMQRHHRHGHHDHHVSRAWLTLRGDYERLAASWSEVR